MSHVIPEEVRNSTEFNPHLVCPLVRAEADEPVIMGQTAFKEHIIAGLHEMAEDEYGDELPSSPHHYYKQIMQSNPELAHLPREKAHTIATGAIDCARNRYMGLCATNGCANRDAMTEKLVMLDIEEDM